MLRYDDAHRRLLNHANLSGAPHSLDCHDSIRWVLWDSGKSKVPPPLSRLVDDILSCLDAVNRHLNGPLPSQRTPSFVVPDVPGQLAYAVAIVIESGLAAYRRWSRTGFFDREICDALMDALHRIAFAWEQVLAGDIDDLLEGSDYVDFI